MSTVPSQIAPSIVTLKDSTKNPPEVVYTAVVYIVPSGGYVRWLLWTGLENTSSAAYKNMGDIKVSGFTVTAKQITVAALGTEEIRLYYTDDSGKLGELCLKKVNDSFLAASWNKGLVSTTSDGAGGFFSVFERDMTTLKVKVDPTGPLMCRIGGNQIKVFYKQAGQNDLRVAFTDPSVTDAKNKQLWYTRVVASIF